MMVKVCGITHRSSLERITSLPIDWLGFIFVRSSPRYAGKLPIEIPTTDATSKQPKRIGVFRDETTHAILNEVARWRLDGIQLHGEETNEQVIALKAEGLLVIKAIGLKTVVDLQKTAVYQDSGLDYFLFDTPGGGTGKSFDWTILSHYQGPTPFLLAGGIGPASLDDLRKINHPQFAGIDLNSRFEIAPGIKDFDVLEKFLAHEI